MNSSAELPTRRRIAGERRKKSGVVLARAMPTAAATGQFREQDVADAPDVDEASGSLAAVDPAAAPEPTEPEPTKPDTSVRTTVSTSRGKGRAVAAAALLLSLLLLAGTASIVLRPAGASGADATAAVAAARTSLTAMLSFDAKTVSTQAGTVAPMLTGDFRQQFTDTMTKEIAPLAVKNGSTVKAAVVEIGVQSQTEHTVTVQAFVNQTRTSTEVPDPSIDQNRVLATLTKVDGRWLISDLKAY